MDSSNDKDNLEVEKRNGGEAVNYHSPSSMPSDWQYGGGSGSFTGMLSNGNSGTTVPRGELGGPSCSSVSIVDSFGQTMWDHPGNSHTLGFNEVNVHAGPSSNSAEALGFGKEIPGSLRGGGGVEACWDAAPSSILRAGLFLPNVPAMPTLPHSLAQFPADSAFIERAARFSSFNAGNLGDMVNPFGINQSTNPYFRSGATMQGPQEQHFSEIPVKAMSGGGQLEGNDVNLAVNSKDSVVPVLPLAAEQNLPKSEGEAGQRAQGEGRPRGAATSLNDSDQAQSSGCGAAGQENQSGGEPSSSKGGSSKKRKRGGQNTETERNAVQHQSGEAVNKDNNESPHKGEQSPSSALNKSSGKSGKQSSQGGDHSKEEYIHVRARRGQATNSHSLAERVRREKISERMKFLQDLVPGCSKVTGKAVMLDEIINYVQSLQRQVEFLSMKLATVNPRLDLNIESLLAKDQMFPSRVTPSLGFSPDLPMAYPPLHPSQSPMIQQPGHPGIVNNSDALRRAITSQPIAVGGVYKEPMQLSNAWEDELHNVVQMGFNPSGPLNSEDTNS